MLTDTYAPYHGLIDLTRADDDDYLWHISLLRIRSLPWPMCAHSSLDIRQGLRPGSSRDRTRDQAGCDVWQQLLDVRAHGCRAAGDGDVGVERWLRVGDRGLLGHADSPDGAKSEATLNWQDSHYRRSGSGGQVNRPLENCSLCVIISTWPAPRAGSTRLHCGSA